MDTADAHDSAYDADNTNNIDYVIFKAVEYFYYFNNWNNANCKLNCIVMICF